MNMKEFELIVQDFTRKNYQDIHVMEILISEIISICLSLKIPLEEILECISEGYSAGEEACNLHGYI